MPIYRKKPIEIEARLLTPDTSSDIVAWMREHNVPVSLWSHSSMNVVAGLLIPTLEGNLEASYGDYIIKGIAGEFYPCKPEIFVNSYDEVK